MYDSQEIANRIKSLAKSKGISLKNILSDCNLGINAISQMSKGNDMLSKNLARIADYLDCSVDYLLGREEQVKKPAPGKGGELSESALRFAALVDRLTPAQQELLLCQLQAWTAQNQQQDSAAPRSVEGTDPESDS